MLISPLRPASSPSPDLPRARGPLSAALFSFLTGTSSRLPDVGDLVDDQLALDVLADDDLQLALYCCYELHYRGFALDSDLEWDTDVLAFRRALEVLFESALRDIVPIEREAGNQPAPERLQAIIDAGDGPSLSQFMATEGTLDQFREFAIHRSLYQLKEADAHTWGIPRFSGRSRSALIEIQMDEYGNGVPGQAHAELFADTMTALGLDPTYGAYVDRVAAPTLATTNLISLFGLHRRLLPALLGHLAVFEMTSVVPMGRYAAACDRLGLDDRARRFYDVHVEADEFHGPLAADHLVGDYVADHPDAEAMVMWGARTLMEVERRFATHVHDRWTSGRSSLKPLSTAAV